MILVKALKPLGFFTGAYRKLMCILCLGVVTPHLAACDFGFLSGNSSSSSSVKTSGQSPQTSGISYNTGSKTNVPGQPSAITVPPPLSGVSANSSAGNLASLQPPRGINAQRLFSYPVDDEEERFARVENAVQIIRDEMDGFAPAITRLVSVEKDIQALVEQLDVLLQNEPAPAVAPVARTPAVPIRSELPQQDLQPVPMIGKAANAKPQSLNPAEAAMQRRMSPEKPVMNMGASGIRNIRISDNKGFTRIVFETSEKLGRRAELDNMENILLIEFFKGQNNVDLSRMRMRSALLKTVSETSRDGGGVVLAFELKNASAILKQGDISPNKDNRNYRYFIDLRR